MGIIGGLVGYGVGLAIKQKKDRDIRRWVQEMYNTDPAEARRFQKRAWDLHKFKIDLPEE